METISVDKTNCSDHLLRKRRDLITGLLTMAIVAEEG